MVYARYSWRQACAEALAESNPKKLLACMEYALTALETRSAQWDTAPGTTAELNAIREAILALGRHTEDKLGSAGLLRQGKGFRRRQGLV